jgi:hypothetical protein
MNFYGILLLAASILHIGKEKEEPSKLMPIADT